MSHKPGVSYNLTMLLSIYIVFITIHKYCHCTIVSSNNGHSWMLCNSDHLYKLSVIWGCHYSIAWYVKCFVLLQGSIILFHFFTKLSKICLTRLSILFTIIGEATHWVVTFQHNPLMILTIPQKRGRHFFIFILSFTIHLLYSILFTKCFMQTDQMWQWILFKLNIDKIILRKSNLINVNGWYLCQWKTS